MVHNTALRLTAQHWVCASSTLPNRLAIFQSKDLILVEYDSICLGKQHRGWQTGR